MRAYFYTITDVPTKLYKTLPTETMISTEIKCLNACGVIELLIVVKNPDYGNYVYIPTFGRYYFITDKQVMKNGLFQLTLKEDVLYTYRDLIYNAVHHITKSSSPIGDNVQYVEKFTKTVLTQNMNNPFKEHLSDVIITIKG